MLDYPKSCRIRAGKDFKFILRSGKKYVQRNVLFFTISGEESKFGVVVSKKCYKSAVKRNRIRRINKELFRHFKHKTAGHNIVVVARPSICKLDDGAIFTETKKQWENFLQCLSKS